MKKRILSILLVSVMLLAMIPAIAVGANDAIETLPDAKTYRTVVTTETIKVDGQLDDVYKNAQKITPSHWQKGSSEYVSFEAYTAVTLQGVFIWAEIKDGTLDKSGSISADLDDKFQIYIKMDDGKTLSWGWYDTDYNGKILKHEVMDAEDLEIAIADGCRYSDIAIGDATYACVKLADGSGWRSETFIPFAVDPANVNQYEVSIGLQACNDASGETNFSVCYDKESVKSAWYGYGSYTPLNLVRMDDVPVAGTLAKNAVYVKDGGFTIDGKKDAMYSEHAKVNLNVSYTSEYAYENGITLSPTMGTVYIAFDDEYIYVYYERYDADLIHDPDNDKMEYLQTCYYFENGGSEKSGYFTALVSPDYDPSHSKTPSVIYSHVGAYRNWPGSIIPKNTFVSANAALGNNTYGVEYKMPIPDAEKAKLAASDDATLNVKMVFSAGDFCSDTTGDGIAEFLGYAGCNPNAAYTYSDYNEYKDKMTLLALSKEFTEEKPGSIYGASLSLGADITVNYYATVGSADIEKTYMRFTRNEHEYIAYPKTNGNSAQYKFSFTNIAPQNIGDNIKAELIVDGKVVDTYDGYSVRQNCINLLANETYASNVKMNNLIKSLLNYGAAAQNYRGYNVEAPVSKNYKVVLSSPTASDSVRAVGTKISDDLRMTSAGVYFDNDNKIYVKFIAKSLKGVAVTMNGEPASIEHVSGDTYIAYSNSIPVTQFGIPYRIVLSNGSASQTAIYSVNSYAYAKLTSTNQAMVELAKATYTYGDAAKKYASIGDTTYKVMTYNDSDNNDPYTDLHGNVVKIIQDTAPDIVGLQEVQQSQQSNYQSLLSDAGYGWIWNSRGASSGGDHYYGELLKPSGVAIAYRTDRFTLKETKHFWLSDTPTKASKYDESDYTHDFVTALLEDKATGEQFVFVCVHLNYLDDANVKQANKLIELMETSDNGYVDYSGYRKIYVGDYNCDPGVQGYTIMNEAGYSATEAMLTNAYKPTTAATRAYIDFCFAKSSEFKTLSYKVINDHPLSLLTSDHYPVVSEVIRTKAYDDVLLPIAGEFPDIPKNPVYNGYDDDFFGEDDRVGF